MRKAWIGAFGAVLLLVACAGPKPPAPVQMQTKFDYDMHKQYFQKGNNTIKGQVIFRQQGGGVVTCAGNIVMLVPATPYFREALSLIQAGEKPGLDRDIAVKAVMRQTQAGAQGNFTFNDLPDGNWVVVTYVKWTVGSSPQGANLRKEVTVAKGETKQVVLSEQDYLSRWGQ